MYPMDYWDPCMFACYTQSPVQSLYYEKTE